MTDDGFVDLVPPTKRAVRVADVVLRTYRVRSAERLSLSIDPDFFGAERVVASWNAKTFELRLTPNPRGAFDLRKAPGKGHRLLLTLELPPGLQVAECREPGPTRFEGKALFVIIPPPMREPPPKVDAIAAARNAVPAPSFSTRKP